MACEATVTGLYAFPGTSRVTPAIPRTQIFTIEYLLEDIPSSYHIISPRAAECPSGTSVFPSVLGMIWETRLFLSSGS
jgi:hypothetical protein